jgi:hypothetical protein
VTGDSQKELTAVMQESAQNNGLEPRPPNSGVSKPSLRRRVEFLISHPLFAIISFTITVLGLFSGEIPLAVRVFLVGVMTISLLSVLVLRYADNFLTEDARLVVDIVVCSFITALSGALVLPEYAIVMFIDRRFLACVIIHANANLNNSWLDIQGDIVTPLIYGVLLLTNLYFIFFIIDFLESLFQE